MKKTLSKNDNVPFTIIANSVLCDPKISFQAKGVFAYLYSKPQDYEFAAERIAKDSKEGVKRVLRGIKELEKEGYVKREKQPDGKMNYYVSWNKEYPNSQNGSLANQITQENAKRPEQLSAKMASISNKEETNNKELTLLLNNKERTPKQKAEDFFTKPDKQEEILRWLVQKGVPEQVGKREIVKFISHWTELNSTGQKQRWQMEKFFDIQRRFITWIGRVKEFNNVKVHVMQSEERRILK